MLLDVIFSLFGKFEREGFCWHLYYVVEMSMGIRFWGLMQTGLALEKLILAIFYIVEDSHL